MAGDVGILVVHGVGSPGPDFARKLIENLERRMRRSGVDPDSFVWRSAWWADLLTERQNGMWDRMQLGSLRWDRMRHFVVNAVGDAAAYHDTGRHHEMIYRDIHEIIRENLASLRKELGSDKKPLAVIAHSLGAHIVSNYIWDSQHKCSGYPGSNFKNWTPFECMDSLALLITAGGQIPLFTLAYPVEEINSIEFPPSSLDKSLKSAAKWLNFYDPDDILAYPLKSLSRSYDEAVTEDLAINVGGIMQSWNPTSHSGYFDDNDFIAPVARALADLLRWSI